MFLQVVSSGPFETFRFKDPLRVGRKTNPFFYAQKVDHTICIYKLIKSIETP
jgi:hypothetical protein